MAILAITMPIRVITMAISAITIPIRAITMRRSGRSRSADLRDHDGAIFAGAHSADRDHPDRVMVIAQIGNVIAESERSDVVLSGCGC